MSFKRWKDVKLEDVCTVIDSLHKTPKYSDSGYPMIRVKDLEEGYLKINNPMYVSEEVYEEFTKKHKPKKGDILFSRVGSYGITTFVNEDIDFCLGQNAVNITNYIDNLDNKFLYYTLISNDIKNQIEEMVTGSTQKTISMKSIKSFILKLPPIEEQKAIAKILSDLDDKIEVNNKINKRLEDMAQSIFKHWFVNFEFPNEEGKPYKSSGGEMVESDLGMIPKGWEVKKIGDIANLTMGVSPTSDSYNYKGEGVPLINGASDFKGKNIEPSKNTTSPKKICELGDLVFGVRATIGNTVFSDDTYAIGRGVASLRALNLIDKEFLYLSLENSMAKLIQNASGSVFLNLKKADISEIKIVYNDYIVKKAHNVLCPIIKKIIKNDKETSKLKELRDTVLPKLMSGEVRVPINKSYR